MSGSPEVTSKLSLKQRLKNFVKHSSADNKVALSPDIAQKSSKSSRSRASSEVISNQNVTAAAGSPDNSIRSLLDKSFERLTEEQRVVLQSHLPSSGAYDVDDAIEQVLSAVRKKQLQCFEERWKVKIHGREVFLHEQADKVIAWLRRFQSVGDVVSNVDPVHLGLPWAAIRFLLEVAVSDAKQMQALLNGCEITLYMSNRLKAYTSFLEHVPDGLEKANFHVALTKLYSCLLGFLSQAISVCEQSTAKRIATSLWKETEIIDYKKNCAHLASNLEMEASNCDRIIRVQDKRAQAKIHNTLLRRLEDIENLHVLQNSIDRVEIKLDLSKMPYVTGAVYDSYDQVHTACHPATRIDLLRRIQVWASDPQSKSIFWLNGKAGTGKSTISFTVAHWLDSQSPQELVTLGASFFFKRSEGDRGTARQFFPTLVHQLANRLPDLKPILAEALDVNNTIATKALGEQFDKLLYRPLRKVDLSVNPPVLVFVVDALDECDRDADIDTILQLWPLLSDISNIPLKLFLTSRPDIPIREGFGQIAEKLHLDIALQDDIPKAVIHQDLCTFIRDKMLRIQQKNDTRFSHRLLGTDWPGDRAIRQMADKAMPLFIVAATVMRFIEASVDSAVSTPDKRLWAFLGGSSAGLTQMAEMYLPVLYSISKDLKSAQEKEELYSNFRAIVGSIISLAEPLSVISLAQLLSIRVADIEPHLHSLHSVMYVPTDIKAPVRPLHLSFSEFLVSEEIRDHPFAVDSRTTHWKLLDQCLRLMSAPNALRENICNLSFPGYLRKDIDSETITRCLPAGLQYACRYWVYHVKHGGLVLSDGGAVHAFLEKYFLNSFEAMSLTGRIAGVIEQVTILQAQLSHNASTRLSLFLQDARRFVLAFRDLADRAPLQIYSSATIFAPGDSIVRRTCSSTPTWIQHDPLILSSWGSELQELEGHSECVYTATFSPDGLLLASASKDMTVRLWDVRIGREVQKLEGHTAPVYAVSFSFSGTLLASTSMDCTIRLWEVQTGRELRKLEGHTNTIFSVSFSPDDSLLTSASDDETIRLWEVQTGEEIRKFEGHTGMVSSVKFSPDGSLLASASDDATIRLWNVQTGQEFQKLEGHKNAVCGVSFSPDGSLLASASDDTTVRLWEVQTGQEIHNLNGHTDVVCAANFSPDGLLLASASHDMSVRLWKVQTGQEIQKLEGHTNGVLSASFSPDGLLVASASMDCTIRIMEVLAQQDAQQDSRQETQLETQQAKEPTPHALAINFSPDGSLLVSTMSNGTIGLWNPATEQETAKLEELTTQLYMVNFSPDGSHLVSVLHNHTILLWRVATGRELQKLEGHTAQVNCATFSSDCLLLASASHDKTVRIWNVRTGQELQRLKAPKCNTINFSPDSALLVGASTSAQTFSLWEIKTGQSIVKDIGVIYFLLRFSPNGSLIAMQTNENSIELFDVQSRCSLRVLEGHEDSINAMNFSSDGSLLASASADQTIMLWDVGTGKAIHVLFDTPIIRTLNFTSDNGCLMTDRGPIHISHITGKHSKHDEKHGTKERNVILDNGTDDEVVDSIFVNSNWVEYRGKELLWLPQQYRNPIAAYRNTVAICQASGQVNFIKFKPHAL